VALTDDELALVAFARPGDQQRPEEGGQEVRPVPRGRAAAEVHGAAARGRGRQHRHAAGHQLAALVVDAYENRLDIEGSAIRSRPTATRRSGSGGISSTARSSRSSRTSRRSASAGCTRSSGSGDDPENDPPVLTIEHPYQVAAHRDPRTRERSARRCSGGPRTTSRSGVTCSCRTRRSRSRRTAGTGSTRTATSTRSARSRSCRSCTARGCCARRPVDLPRRDPDRGRGEQDGDGHDGVRRVPCDAAPLGDRHERGGLRRRARQADVDVGVDRRPDLVDGEEAEGGPGRPVRRGRSRRVPQHDQALATIGGQLVGLPQDYMAFTTDNPPSAESRRAAEVRLIKGAERIMTPFGGGWERVARLFLRFSSKDASCRRTPSR
jgi:hypothetical protein